jgi:hypothetical protein
MKRIVVVAAALLVLASGAVALAAIPSADGTIHGCRDNRTGALRVIDAEAGQSCTAKETALTWNQTGPQGQAGANGVSGYELVVRDVVLASTASEFVTATCPSGKRALGGSAAMSSQVPFNPNAINNAGWPTILNETSFTAVLSAGPNAQGGRVVVSCANVT